MPWAARPFLFTLGIDDFSASDRETPVPPQAHLKRLHVPLLAHAELELDAPCTHTDPTASPELSRIRPQQWEVGHRTLDWFLSGDRLRRVRRASVCVRCPPIIRLPSRGPLRRPLRPVRIISASVRRRFRTVKPSSSVPCPSERPPTETTGPDCSMAPLISL